MYTNTAAYLMNFNSNTSTPIDRCELCRKIQILSVAFGEREQTGHFKVVSTFDRRTPDSTVVARRHCCWKLCRHGLGLVWLYCSVGSNSRAGAEVSLLEFARKDLEDTWRQKVGGVDITSS